MCKKTCYRHYAKKSHYYCNIVLSADLWLTDLKSSMSNWTLQRPIGGGLKTTGRLFSLFPC